MEVKTIQLGYSLFLNWRYSKFTHFQPASRLDKAMVGHSLSKDTNSKFLLKNTHS